MNDEQAKTLIDLVWGFVERHDDLRALGVCGSWARGHPSPNSDLDLVIIARNPNLWRTCEQWVRELPFEQFGFEYMDHRTASYGAAWSVHVELEPCAELELTFAAETWASVESIDPGTQRVVTDGFEVIVDKDGLLARLVDAAGKLEDQKEASPAQAAAFGKSHKH